MWAIGVVVYVLLGGYPPFHDDGTKAGSRACASQIQKGEYEFEPEYWDPVSADAKALIRGLLTLNPTQRLTVDQALAHPWVSILASLRGYSSRFISPSCVAAAVAAAANVFSWANLRKSCRPSTWMPTCVTSRPPTPSGSSEHASV